jgi:hypothetical protein
MNPGLRRDDAALVNTSPMPRLSDFLIPTRQILGLPHTQLCGCVAAKRTSAYRVVMLHIVLYQPEIPPNTGNIIRLCANTGTQLHLVRPLGFELDNSKLKRAGLDYREFAAVRTYDNFEELRAQSTITRFFACSTKGSMGMRRMFSAENVASNSVGKPLDSGPKTKPSPG